MADLISREAAIELFTRRENELCQRIEAKTGRELPIRPRFAEGIASVLNSLSAVDAVEVVRCRDCIHCALTEDGEYNPQDIVCEWWATDGLKATDFCSRGKRREENG